MLGWQVRQVAALIIVAAFIVAGLVWMALGKDSPPSESAIYAPFRIDEKSAKIRNLMTQALAGSAPAAADLAEMYGHCHKAGLSGDRLKVCFESAKFWTDVAAENGSEAGIKYRINDLIATRQCREVLRAKYWYNKLISNKYSVKLTPGFLDDLKEAQRSCRW